MVMDEAGRTASRVASDATFGKRSRALVRWALAAAITTALLGLAQPPLSLWPLPGIALVPWLRVLPRSTPLVAVLGSLVVGLAYGAVTAWWVPEALRGLGSAPGRAALALAVLALWGKGLPFALLGGLVHACRRRSAGARVLALALGVLAVEALASHWRWGLPWALLGHTQGAAPGVAQLAVVAGVPLLSALLAALNQAIALAWERGGRESTLALAGALAAAWLALAALGMPVAERARAPSDSAHPVRLLVVQPNLPRGERWSKSHQRLHLKRIGSYTQRALELAGEAPDAILWPENLLTTPVDTNAELAAELRRWVDALGVPVILGAARGSRSRDPQRFRGSVLWMEPERGVVAAVDKQRAIPVLESASGSAAEGILAQLFGRAARWKKVEEAVETGPLRHGFTLSPVLCYEALFPGLVAARRPPESLAILNLADDSWVEGAMATRQLVAFSTFRAIEQRLPLVRVAHGGLSVVTDAFGRAVEELPLDAYAYTVVELVPSPPPTLAERAALLALPLTTGLGVWWLLRLRRKGGRTHAT
jgi:apolipoprotein N-acyltransferase